MQYCLQTCSVFRSELVERMKQLGRTRTLSQSPMGPCGAWLPPRGPHGLPAGALSIPAEQRGSSLLGLFTVKEGAGLRAAESSARSLSEPGWGCRLRGEGQIPLLTAPRAHTGLRVGCERVGSGAALASAPRAELHAQAHKML